MGTWFFPQVAVILALALALPACRQVDGEDGGGGEDGGNSADGSTWILGTWSGLFKSKSSDGSSTASETPARATFTGGDDFTGEFVIELPQIDGAYAKGSFQDFAKESLMLKMTDSKVSALGLDETQTLVDYELTGNALKMSNDRISLRLIREKPADTNDDDDQDDGDPAAKANGRYNCTDIDGRLWEIHVKGGSSFSAILEKATYMDGPAVVGAAAAPYDAVLTVDKSNDKSTIGTELKLKLDGDLDMTMTVESQQIPCRRI